MRYGILSLVAVMALGGAGCPGSDGEIGEPCGGHGDCDGNLQCSTGVCVPRCARAPECGDGFACSNDGICTLATGQPGDGCTSEVDCSPGLSCQIDGTAVEGSHLLASCTAQGDDGKPAGGACITDSECRNGTCALGQCVDLCSVTRDCASGYSCMDIPRVEASGSLFGGCLPSKGNVVWTIPISAPTANILMPVPSAARYASLVFSVDDLQQRVGAQALVSPSGQSLYSRPCSPAGPDCDPTSEFYDNIVRHDPELGQSVIAFPSTPDVPLETGTYRVQMSSYRRNGSIGSAIPHVTAVVRIDTATLLDLRFHFLDLDEHPCQTEMGGGKFDAAQAQTAPFFQEDFVGSLREIFVAGGIAFGNLTYDDISNRPDLDELDVVDSGSLLSLGTGATGIDVFFVRALSPVGLQAFGPNPGPAGLAGTRQSGIVIGLDSLCYRSWTQLARLTAHELARYMGLSHNVELGSNPAWKDPIDDSDLSDDNLMFFSELGGTDISPGQRDILSRSGVLR
jgi:hypothetical protein